MHDHNSAVVAPSQPVVEIVIFFCFRDNRRNALVSEAVRIAFFAHRVASDVLESRVRRTHDVAMVPRHGDLEGEGVRV